MHKIQYPLSVLYRFILAFGIGYICSYLLSLSLIDLFYPYLAKAESIYLAAFSALIFYIIFVIFSFCIQSLRKLSTIILSLLSMLFLLSKLVG
mgnify:FL=1